jgi:hypothetical protein
MMQRINTKEGGVFSESSDDGQLEKGKLLPIYRLCNLLSLGKGEKFRSVKNTTSGRNINLASILQHKFGDL